MLWTSKWTRSCTCTVIRKRTAEWSCSSVKTECNDLQFDFQKEHICWPSWPVWKVDCNRTVNWIRRCVFKRAKVRLPRLSAAWIYGQTEKALETLETAVFEVVSLIHTLSNRRLLLSTRRQSVSATQEANSCNSSIVQSWRPRVRIGRWMCANGLRISHRHLVRQAGHHLWVFDFEQINVCF